MKGFPSYNMFDFPGLTYILKMKRDRQQPKRREADQHRSNSNQLAKRLYRNNSLTRLTPLGSSPSAIASLNTSLIPSVSLRKLAKLQVSQPSIEFSQGRILLRRSQDPSSLSQTGTLVKKKAQHRKFDKIDSITEKSIVPDELKPAYEEEPRKFKPSKKWLAKLKQGKENLTEKLTPEDFMQLLEQQGGLGNEFCYLQRGEHPYDLRIVEFAGAVGDEYITISSRGVTYFNWEGSRFVGLAEWRREATLFRRLMSLEFFGKYKLHKNFTNWKKYARKVAMKKTTDKLKAELLVHDRHLRQALLSTRTLCCRMENQTNYCSLDDAQPALPFTRFKAAQENYLADRFQRRLGELEEEIKGEVGRSLGVSMRQFKQQNKISSGKQGKGLPLLIGDEKNLEMPYTKEATLRVQQQKFKRFLKLIELLVVHAKINMMDEATLATARKLTEQNDAYADHLLAITNRNGKDGHFKGKQYIECHLQLEESEQRVALRPTKEELTNLMEDIVNRSIIKLVRNHHRIIHDPDINAILYQGAEEPPRDPDPPNTLKAILGAEQKQEAMVGVLTRAISRSYSFLEVFANQLSPLVAQFFTNQGQLTRIPALTSQDFFSIREWVQRWRKELADISKLNEEHESAVFLLNFRNLKDMAIQCANLCLTRVKEIVPRILQQALRRQQQELRQSLRLMETAPIGIEVFIAFQHNKTSITAKFDRYQDTLAQIGQLIDIMKQLGGTGESTVARSIKQKKQLGEMLKLLRAKIEEAQMHSKVHESYAQEEVRKMIPKIYHSLAALYAKTKQPRLEPVFMAERISEWEGEFASIDGQLSKLRQYQRFLGMEELAEDTVNKFAQYFQVYKEIWCFSLDVEDYHSEFMKSNWKTLSLDEAKNALEKFLETAERIKKCLGSGLREDQYQIEYTDENIVGLVVADIKKKLRPVLEAVECLRDPSLEERELRFVRAQFQRRGRSALSDLLVDQGLVRGLVGQGVTEELDFLKKIVFKSKKQLELNSKMAAVSRFWGESVGHSSKSLIDNFAQHYWTIAAEIDEKLTVINCVRDDPEVEEGQFRARVENEKALFDALRTVLGEWERHHNYLSYFEPIFLNPYWKGTGEFKAYAYAESNWKKLTKQIGKDFSLRKLASQQKKHLAVLRQNNSIFEQLKKAVQLFLTAKREAFPKLYFIPNEQLLHLLLQDKDYTSIDKNLSRIFPSLKSLELNEERNCPLAVRSLTNESLALRPSPAKQVLELQQGLRVIEDRMKEAVRSGLLKCSNYYLQDDFSRKIWINDNILQVLLFIGNAEFTKLLEYDYLQPEGEDLSQLLTYQLTQIRELYSFIRDQLSTSAPRNYKLQVLLMQSGHFRDIIQRLQQLQIQDDLSYEWQRQIRSYYNGGELAVTRYLTKTVDYGYEFVCPNYSFTLATLSEHQFVALANAVAFHYLPVLHGNSPLVQHFCNANARNHFAVDLHPELVPQHLHNLCQGALASTTFLELRQGQYIDSRVTALLATFLNQAKCILDRREVFHLPPPGKNALPVPTFSVAIRLAPNIDAAPLKRTLLLPHRVLQVPQISISAYLDCLIALMFDSCDSDISKRVEKTCEIINKCSGYCVLGLQQVRASAVKSLSPHILQFKAGVAEGLMKEVAAKIVQIEEVKFYEGVIKEVILQEKIDEIQKKVKQERDSTNIPAFILQILAKKAVVVIVGPSYAGKQFSIGQANKTAGVAKGELFLTDLVPPKLLLGHFENGLWKQGFLPRHVKTLSPSQQQWILLEGEFTPTLSMLLSGVLRGQLLLANGELMYLSPNWKFIFSCEMLSPSIDLPEGCPLICSEVFTSSEEQLQVALQTQVAPFFKSNPESYALLKNLCVNNFQRVLKFRLKGRFLKPEHLLLNFVRLLRAQLSQTALKSLQQRGNQQAIEKLFLWSLYWTLSLSLASDQAKKFESQFFQQVKIEIDRTQPLSLSKLELESPQGAFRRVQGQIVQLDGLPFLLEAERAALCETVKLLLGEGRHVLLTGAHSSGKSGLLRFLREWLGRDGFSFLRIRLHKQLSQQQFTQLLHRKARVILSSSRQKSLSALNGRRLVLVLDDFNCLEESSSVGRFISSLLALGYYYDPLSLEKIHLGNICLLAAENSSHEFTLSYDLLRNFQPVNIPSLNLRDIAPLYQEYLPAEYAANITHNLCALHDFATAGCENVNCYWPVEIDSPLRILEGLKHYGGKQNTVKVWQYLSLKEYVNSHPPCSSTADKIVAQVKNYSNLMLKNSQDSPQTVQNVQNILKELAKKSGTEVQVDYYVYLATLLQLTHPTHLFTINEPLCPSAKIEQLQILCQMYDLQLLRPYRRVQVVSRSGREGKVVVYAAESDEYFGEMVELALQRYSGNVLFLLDFESDQRWKATVNQYPAICHAGSRYYRTSAPPSNPFHSEFEYWNTILLPLSCPLDNYTRQQVQRIIRRSHDKIAAQTEAQITKNEQILATGTGLQSRSLELRKQIEKCQAESDQLGKDEEQKRKELLTLKNSYESDDSQNQKNAKTASIQAIQLALNDIMNRKRANEDHTRSKNQEYNSHHKTSAVLAPLLTQAQQQLVTLRQIASHRQRITVFLALTEYFLGKGQHTEAIETASQHLPISFVSLTQHLFSCQAYIHEHSLVLWLLNQRTLLLQSDNNNFIELLQKRWPKTHILTTTKDLEELGQPQPGTAYIIVGELRSEAKFLIDVAASSSENERGKNKDDNKQQKFVKEFKEERPDYFKQIYIIIKEGGQIQQPVSVRSPKEGSFRDQVPSTRRPERKVTRLNTFRNTLSVPTNKPELTRSDRITTRHELLAKIKCREMRDGQPIGRSESELQDCLTISIEDEVYQSGGKRITSVLWKGMRTPATFTLLCRKKYPRTQREQVKQHRAPLEDSSEGLAEELLQSVRPSETMQLANLRQELQKLKSKKEMQEKGIVQRMMDASHRNLAEIGKKEGDFLLNLAQSIKNIEEKIKNVLEVRGSPYRTYFSLCVSLWKCTQLFSAIYPLFRISKELVRSLFLSSIVVVPTEEGEEVDSEQSQKQIVKTLIEYVVGCMGYREGLWCLGLMAVVIEVEKGVTDKKYIDLLTSILKGQSSSKIIQDHLNKHSCSKQLNKLLESISRTTDHSHPFHAYLVLSLNFDFEQQYPSLKLIALSHKLPFITISNSTTDAYAEITHGKDCILLKENADYTKNIEVMAERGFNKLILVNFTKEENYARLNSIIDDSPFAGRCQVVLLYTEKRIWWECNFKQQLSQMRIIQLDSHITPQQQIAAMLTRNYKQIKPELQKIIKLVGYLEIQNFLKELVFAKERQEEAGSANFYGSDFLHSLGAELAIGDAKKLVEIACETVLQGNEKWIIKESRKYLKKQQGDALCRIFMGDATISFEDHNPQLAYFMSLDLVDLPQRLTTAQQCEDFVRFILPSEIRKHLKMDIFHLTPPIPLLTSSACAENLTIATCWSIIDELVFQNMKNLESVKLKREGDLFKAALRRENNRSYLLYRWLQHNVKALRSLDRHSILSEQTIISLYKLAGNQPLWSCPSITQILNLLQKRISHIQELLQNPQPIRKLNLSHWGEIPTIFHLHLYCPRRGDLYKQQLICRCPSEKDDRGWTIDEVQLVNCSYDAVKGSLQAADRSDNRKLKINLVLGEKETGVGPLFGLPLMMEGKELFKAELPTRLREEGCTWREKAVGQLIKVAK